MEPWEKKRRPGGKVAGKLEAIATRKDDSLLEQRIDAPKAKDAREKDDEAKRGKRNLKVFPFPSSLVILT